MEVAGVLPPPEKFTRTAKAARPSAVSSEDESVAETESEDGETPLLLHEEEELDPEHHKVPKSIEHIEA